MHNEKEKQFTFGQLTGQLQQHEATGFTYDEAGLQKELHAQSKTNYPLVVRAVIVLGAWIGGVLLSSFLGFFLLAHNQSALMIAGVVFIITSLILPRLPLLRIAVEPFALSLSIIGTMLLMVGMDYDFDRRESMHNLFVALIELGIAILTVSRVQRSVGVFGFFMYLAIYFRINLESPLLVMVLIGICALLIVWMQAKEAWVMSKAKPLIRVFQPVLGGLVFALPALLVFTLFRDRHHHTDSLLQQAGVEGWWPASVGLVIAVLLTLRIILRDTCGFRGARLAALLLLALLLLAPMAKAPGIVGGLLLITSGFYSGNKIALGLGLVSLVFYCSAFYYQMETTLFVKSILLLVSGALLIGAALVFNYLNKQQS